MGRHVLALVLALAWATTLGQALYEGDYAVASDADLVACLANNATCSRLDISKRGLTGTVPTEIASLSMLQWLDVQGNNLTGTLPTEIAKLSVLMYMDFGLPSGNRASGIGGPIPSELGELRQLQWLSASGAMTGTIPTELGKVDGLQYLSFGGNLTGTLPTELATLTNMKMLFLPIHSLTGTIPTELGLYDQVLTMWLYENMLTGTIPTEFGNLSRLVVVSLRANSLTGTLPTELGRVTELTKLRVKDNNLTGTFPPSLVEVESIKWWSTEGNNFTDVLPEEFVERVSPLHELALQVDPWNLPSFCVGCARLGTSEPAVPAPPLPLPPPINDSSLVKVGDGGNDHDVIVAVICGPVAAVLVLSVLVLWYLKLGCFNTASSSELEFAIKTPDDWLTGHNPSRREWLQTSGSGGSSSREQHSDAVAELSFWQVAQSKSATMIGLVMRRGSKSVRTSLVSRLDGPIASMRDFVNSPQVFNPPPSSSMWEVTQPADVQGMLSLNASTVEATAEQSPGVDRSDMTNIQEHDLEAASADSEQVVPPFSEAISPSRRTGSSVNSLGSEVAPTLSSGQRIVSGLSGRMYKGNFGVVWMAKDIRTNELFVMKLPLRRKDIALFLHEVELHRSLDSSFIVAFVESFELQEGWPVMVLEACRFGNGNAMLMAVRMAGKKHVEEVVVSLVLLHMLLGLSYLHKEGVVHRDIKLDNVMVDDALTFKLGDLGTAKRLDGTVNMTTTFAGTPVYMAPEVVRRDPYNEKSDIWSLGHLLYELCTHELLFNPSTLQSLRNKHDEPYKAIDQSYYSAGLVATVAWMLTADPAKRPSANEVLACPFVRKLMRDELDTKTELRNSLRGDF